MAGGAPGQSDTAELVTRSISPYQRPRQAGGGLVGAAQRHQANAGNKTLLVKRCMDAIDLGTGDNSPTGTDWGARRCI